MGETRKVIQPEIQATRTYLEEIVAGKVICPPLASIMKPFRDAATGDVDWDGLSSKVELISYKNVPLSQLQSKLADQYIRYLSYAYNDPENAPATRVWILPNFATNEEFDALLARTREEIRDRLLSTTRNRNLVIDVFAQEAPRRGVPQDDVDIVVDYARRGDVQAMNQVVVNVIQGIFVGADIYGNPLTDTDLQTFPTVRGPVDRYRYLNRGPYYMWQSVSPFAVDMYMGQNAEQRRRALEAKNTQLAAEADLAAHEGYLEQLRNKS